MASQKGSTFIFAGEYLSHLRGWQEGAIVSALAALSQLAGS